MRRRQCRLEHSNSEGDLGFVRCNVRSLRLRRTTDSDWEPFRKQLAHGTESDDEFLNLYCDDRDVTKMFLTQRPAPVGIISMKSPTHFWIRAVAATAVFVLSLAAASATTTNVIFSFEEDEGEYADTDLETDDAGNIYGTTVLGGDFGSGTVFKLSPTPTGWMHTVLYSFTSGADGGEPYKGVTLDREGNLYGTAVTGGSGSCEGGCGVVYKLTNSAGTWTQTVIHAFTGGDDGSGPGARVTVDPSGNVYGMTPTGGAYGLGTIYKIHQEHNGGWNLEVIHAFTGGADGATGSAGRMILRHGHLYGAATAGGTYGSGVVFELTPRGVGEWDFRTIYSFRGQPDGSFPYAALLFDRLGNIYGTTYYGGANGIGAVYELSPQPIGEWNESVLYSFQEGSDGNSPIGNLVSDSVGNLYGTTC